MSTNFRPYTYLIGWSSLDRWYYGCQYRRGVDPQHLWTTYFTSSSSVKQFRSENGDPDVIEVRRIFKTAQVTRRCEDRVLKRVGAVKSLRWLNKAISGKADNTGKVRTLEQRTRISQAKKGTLPWNTGMRRPEETRNKIAAALINRPRTWKNFEEYRRKRRIIAQTKPPPEPPWKKKRTKQKDAARTAHQRAFIVTSPSGETLTVINLRQFAKQRGLHGSHLSSSPSGSRGWKASRLPAMVTV